MRRESDSQAREQNRPVLCFSVEGSTENVTPHTSQVRLMRSFV
jgi:hypothetical protein